MSVAQADSGDEIWEKHFKSILSTLLDLMKDEDVSLLLVLGLSSFKIQCCDHFLRNHPRIEFYEYNLNVSGMHNGYDLSKWYQHLQRNCYWAGN